jgi:hypothetical protein
MKSMNDALKPGQPIGMRLDQSVSAYRAWFEGWKGCRDKIKYGADFELSYDDENLWISFVYAMEQGSHVANDRIGLSNVIEGLEMSTRLTVAAFELVKGDLLRIDWPPA